MADCALKRASGVSFAKKKGLRRKAGPPVHDRSCVAVLRYWLIDPMRSGSHRHHEHRTEELYCCAIKDVYSNRIVGSAFWIE